MVKASSSEWSSALSGGADTIVARATAAGGAAIAVLRMTGPQTRQIAATVSRDIDFDRPWVAQLVDVSDADAGSERVVAIPFRAPRSYTGEDMLELMVHGSPYWVDELVGRLVAGGARSAGPGEFTRRAVANGKMDLVQAEAVRDLVASETAWQARNARQQLAGVLSARLCRLRDELLALSARLEAGLDFAAQGIELDREAVTERLDRCRAALSELLATATAGARIRDGVKVVVSGPPNSGKSTLFNILLGLERAIVDPKPGTTRDVLEAELDVGGLLVTLVDTAGQRPTDDPVEAEGVRRARAAEAEAGVIIRLWPADAEGSEPEGKPPGAGVSVVLVRSKADLLDGAASDGGRWLPVSSVTGLGIDRLRLRLRAAVLGEVADLGGEVAIGRRHRQSLEAATAELARCDLDTPELAAENVRMAAVSVSEMVGAVTTEELLDEIFSSFCIGK